MSEAGKRLIQSAQEALAFAKGEANPDDYRVIVPDDINVKKIREALGMSQDEFAGRFGFSLQTLQAWEQGQSTPQGVAKNFLILLSREPEIVQKTLLAAESA